MRSPVRTRSRSPFRAGRHRAWSTRLQRRGLGAHPRCGRGGRTDPAGLGAGCERGGHDRRRGRPARPTAPVRRSEGQQHRPGHRAAVHLSGASFSLGAGLGRRAATARRAVPRRAGPGGVRHRLPAPRYSSGPGLRRHRRTHVERPRRRRPSNTGALFVYRGTPAEGLATELGIRTVAFTPDTYGIHVNGATVVDSDNDRLIDRLPISSTAREQLRALRAPHSTSTRSTRRPDS